MDNRQTFADKAAMRTHIVSEARSWALAGTVALLLVVVALVRRPAVDRQLLIFDVGIALAVAAVCFYVARRFIIAEALHRRRDLAAILAGVIAAGASLGVLALTLSGKPVGLAKAPALVVIQLLGLVCGGFIALLGGLVAASIVSLLRHLVRNPSAVIDGIFIGAFAGLVVGLAALPLPHLGPLFVATSLITGAVCGSRAALFHERRKP